MRTASNQALQERDVAESAIPHQVAQDELQPATTVHLLGSTSKPKVGSDYSYSVPCVRPKLTSSVTDLVDFLETDVDRFFRSTVSSSSTPAAQRRSALRAYSWIAKGLIVRSDQRGYAMVERVLDPSHDLELYTAAAASLGVTAEGKDGVLGKGNSKCSGRSGQFLLYLQRFLTCLPPNSVDLHETSTANGDAKNICLVALASSPRHILKQLTLSKLRKLLPLLTTSLDIPDASLRANVIDALSVLVSDVPTEREDSISGVTTKVLRGLPVTTGPRDMPAGTVSLPNVTVDTL
ncbi:hypothetical protein JCM10908_002594 [Rhodotorula pacifica]|uniref:uncharacterized protein n=1 Tax=Rhodotorula pacifica TaxID=1495444 RepID=UPI0031715753